MKILLTTLNSKFIHTNLAIRYLKEFVRDIQTVDIKEYTINNSLDYILKDIHKGNYDVVLFSTYIWNVDDISKLCENIKKINQNIKIALGGPEVSYDSVDFMEKHSFVDYILFGEGELVFKDLVLTLQNKKELKDTKGIVYRENGEIIKTDDMPYLYDLDLIPSPYDNLDISEYENRIVYYETSRGCPFNCQYCLSSTLEGLRYFSIERVKKDLKNLIDAKVSQIKFIDRTFNANKKFAKEIMNFLMENDNDYTTYHFEVTAHLLTDDMIDFLENCKEGLFQFEIGVQTTNQDALNEVGRRDDFNKLSYVVRKIASFRNIHQHLDLIAGLPFENYDSFENSFNDVFNLGIEHIQLGFLKMIKGTGVRNRADIHGYQYKDYAPYEILFNNYINYDEMLKLKDIEDIIEKYYNSKNFTLSMRYIIFNYYSKSPFKFFEEFASYFDDNGHFDISQGKNQLYNILLDFYFEKVNKNNELFRDILKYDYVSLGKTSNIPNFFDKYEIEDFKNRCHVFLQNEEHLEMYLPKFVNVPAKQIIKSVHFENFKFDIIKLKSDVKCEVEKVDNIIMFYYDDKKIFEKSKTFKVSL
ncbi:MAG: B12-binding domain-containing radical SAM protein [Peptostreptococcaceae bacterium]